MISKRLLNEINKLKKKYHSIYDEKNKKLEIKYNEYYTIYMKLDNYPFK